MTTNPPDMVWPSDVWFECPVCGTVSYHPMDRTEGYCSACHDFTAPPRRGSSLLLFRRPYDWRNE